MKTAKPDNPFAHSGCPAALYFVFILTAFYLFSLLFTPSLLAAENQPTTGGQQVELNGDSIEYTREGNVVIVQGNVEVVHKDTTLLCDRVEFSRDTNIAHATGDVRLVTGQGEVRGNELTFNYTTMTGEFNGAKIVAQPYYGGGEKIAKVGENKIEVEQGYVSTCDLDKPHFHMASKKIEVYPGDKIVARNSQIKVGNVPLLYLPIFTHKLDDKKPRILFTPGFDSDWGAFVLGQYRYYLNESAKGVLHFDYREKLDFASGADLDYTTKNFGSGRMRTYYTNERRISSDHPWQEKPTPTVETERFKGEWRHKWDVDDKTSAIWQYYKLSDSTFLKDYFEREYEEDANPATFFLLTRRLPKGTLSLETDVRVNRFESKTEKLPEMRYDLTSLELGDTGLYFKDTTTLSNLDHKTAAPSDDDTHTKRADTDYEFSYPFKAGLLEFNPFVGAKHTYYTETNDPDKRDTIRGIFRTGSSLSTKFYRLFDVESEKFGLDIHRLRHIITPSVFYEYTNEPTLNSNQLVIYDAIDNQSRVHNLNFSLENKLQTKRDGNTVELLRFVLGTDYHLKEDPRGVGFDAITSDVDFRPTDWLSFYFDSSFDTRADVLSTANFDIFINSKEKWYVGLGKRYNRDVNDEITTYFKYVINPKWTFRSFGRFDIDAGELEEQNYALVRDLHEWEMELNIDDKKDNGTEFLLIFSLKAFPEIGFDFGKTFNEPKRGSTAQ